MALIINNKISIYGNGVTFAQDTPSRTVIIRNSSNILINGINFLNHVDGVQKPVNSPITNDITIENCKFNNISNPIY